METAVLEQPEISAQFGGGQPPAGYPGVGAPAHGGGAPAYGGGMAPPSGPPPGVTTHTTADSITGIPAYGTAIQVLSSSGTPETYQTISGVGDITGPNTSVAEVETTSHSTGSPHRTFIPTLIDDGELAFPSFWNPADPTQSISSTYGLEYLFQNRLVTKFRLINTDQGHRTRAFRGFVRNLGETYPVQGVCTRNVTIRITSVPTDEASPIAMTPASASPVAAGGPGTFNVTTGGAIAAPWTAAADVAWITITSPSTPTSGDGMVNYNVAINAVASPARVGHIMIAALGLSFTVNQAAG